MPRVGFERLSSHVQIIQRKSWQLFGSKGRFWKYPENENLGTLVSRAFQAMQQNGPETEMVFGAWVVIPRRARIRGSWTLVSLSLRLKDLLGSVTRVKKKKQGLGDRASLTRTCTGGGSRRGRSEGGERGEKERREREKRDRDRDIDNRL